VAGNEAMSSRRLPLGAIFQAFTGKPPTRVWDPFKVGEVSLFYRFAFIEQKRADSCGLMAVDFKAGIGLLIGLLCPCKNGNHHQRKEQPEP
jgi:hypothetical protein